MFLVGVTGGMGAGKTAALKGFADLGARTMDTDSVVHELYGSDLELVRHLTRRWGNGVLAPDGTVDRKYVAERVFGDDEELGWLNRQVHPRVKNRILQYAQEAASPLFCAIPLLYEVKWDPIVQCVISIWCGPEIQQERLRQRGWDDRDIRRRATAQLGMDEKLRRSDYGIINCGSRTLLKAQCKRVLDLIDRRIKNIPNK